MWKTLSSSQRALLRLIKLQKCERTFLSDAYRCTEAWNERLKSPLLSKVKPNEMFVELDERFQSVGKVSAVDVDIYANVITEPDRANELIDVLHQLRLTMEATNILDSTHHAVIRYLLDNNEVDDLLTVLHDRINYGIFPDYLCYNILMDTFLKREDLAAAAKVAVLLMLQEDSEHPISNALAVYSCYKYLEKPEVWKAPEPEPEDTGEVIKVRVGYLRNPYFDDHFDITDPSELVGKTLVFFGKSMDDTLGRTFHLRGLALWKKYKDGADLIKRWTEDGRKELVYAEVLPQIREILSGVTEDKATDELREFKKELEALSNSSLKEGSVIGEIESRVEDAVAKQADIDIATQCQSYKDWEKRRVTVLEKQMAELDKKARLAKVEEMKKELATRERLLTYFDRKSQVELAIDNKLKYEKKKYGKRIRTKVDVEDNYVPPEIVKKRL